MSLSIALLDNANSFFMSFDCRSIVTLRCAFSDPSDDKRPSTMDMGGKKTVVLDALTPLRYSSPWHL
jgi:hypothetical protein